MTPVNTVAATGFTAFCAMIIHDPVVSFGLMTLILLTCIVVLAHVLWSCFNKNRFEKRKKKLKQEKANARTAADAVRP